MNPAPKVSAILSTYNRAGYVKEAIESVRAQTFGDWELIVVNDGSADATKTLLENYVQKDRRIRAIHQSNSGMSKARNNAIRTSQSKYLAFLDDDDIWMSEKLEKQVAYLESHADVVLLFTLAHVTDGELRSGRIFPEKRRCTLEGLLAADPNFIPFSSVMVRRAPLDRVGLFDENLQRSVDYDLWLRIVRQFPFDCLDEPLILYRQHGENMALEASGRHLAHLVTFRKMLEYPESKPFVGLIKCRVAREYYELGRISREGGKYLPAAWFFAQSLTACPWVGWQLRRYHPRLTPLFSLMKPYLATAYCFIRGLAVNGRRREVVT